MKLNEERIYKERMYYFLLYHDLSANKYKNFKKNEIKILNIHDIV